MKIADLLPSERIVVPLPGKTLHDAAEQLMGSFVDTGLATEGAKLLERVGETPPREAFTVGNDAFLLHFRSDAVCRVGASLGITAEPVRLAPDSEKSARIVVVLVAPYKEASVFLQAVGALARALSREEVVERVLASTSPAEVSEVAELMELELPGYVTVGDVMSARPRSVWPDAPLEDVARVMVANKLPALPVTSEEGAVLGIVTHRDLLQMALPRYLKQLNSGEITVMENKRTTGEPTDPRVVPVREVMDRSVLCVSEEQTLADVANMIVAKGVDRFPVVRDGQLVGLLTRDDIVRRLFGP